MQEDHTHQNANAYEQQSHQNAQQFHLEHQPVSKHPKLLKSSKFQFLRKRWISFTIISVACLMTAGLVYLLLNKVNFKVNPNTDVFYKKRLPKPKTFYSSLSHLAVGGAELVNQPITGIMIENSPSARPQSGLKEAELVFEAIAEGGITRFLAFYQVNKPQLVGPVRSVREYYIDWLTPFNASIAHIGGSREALNLVRNGSYRDLDQFFNAGFYWRARDRYAPHNVYTNFAKMDELNRKKNYTKSEPEMFARQVAKASDKITATQIDMKISGPLYNVKYTYDKTTNTYHRFLGGKKHLDREKGQITPSAVIAIMTNMQRVLEDGYRERITTVGEGKAYIFQNGQLIEATWKKPARNKQIRFYGPDGKEIPINAGQVWITAVPKSSGSVTWS